MPDLPSPLRTWKESSIYILKPFEKRGEMDQGIALLAYYMRPETWPAIGYDGPWLGRVPVAVIPVPRPAGVEGPRP